MSSNIINKKNDNFVPTAIRVSKLESSIELLTKDVYKNFISIIHFIFNLK